jgi:UDP-N-acetylglucosamine 2-epimerase (non-hydrolysing)
MSISLINSKLSRLPMKVCIIIGTRPEIIKMSPLIRECQRRKLDSFILHTGQHYSYEMDKKFFIDLELPEPRYNLDAGGQEYRKQLGMMIRDISQVLSNEKPDIMFVQGDTNSVLAAALAANKLGIKIGHHEAGLRSHDLTMLEETNRIITDHISDYLFAPTEDAQKNINDEGIKAKTCLTGNTIVDAVKEHAQIAERKSSILSTLSLKKGGYVLVTAHRAENVDNKERLSGIISGLQLVMKNLNMPVIFPMHPRTRKNIASFSISADGLRVIPPLGYLDFLQLEMNAKLIITDSGGLQEEACILKIPCVTVRDNTERPETVKAGINILAGTDPKKIAEAAQKISKYDGIWINPFGDGKAAESIISSTITWLKVEPQRDF